MKLEFSQQVFEKYSTSDLMKVCPAITKMFHVDP